jgi:hypothetical protein
MLLKNHEDTIFNDIDLKKEILTAYSPAITIDLEGELFTKIMEFKDIPIYILPIEIEELKYLDSIMRKVMALEAAFGMLNDLTSEQIMDFDEAVKRKAFFK